MAGTKNQLTFGDIHRKSTTVDEELGLELSQPALLSLPTQKGGQIVTLTANIRDVNSLLPSRGSIGLLLNALDDQGNFLPVEAWSTSTELTFTPTVDGSDEDILRGRRMPMDTLDPRVKEFCYKFLSTIPIGPEMVRVVKRKSNSNNTANAGISISGSDIDIKKDVKDLEDTIDEM